MKKIISLLLLIAMFCTSFTALAAYKEETAVLPETFNAITLRAGKGTGYKALGYVHDGDEILILKKMATWSRIKIVENGRVGYIKNIYIGHQKRPSKTCDWGHVSKDLVSTNLRSARSKTSKLKKVLKGGAKLQLLSKSSGWYRAITSDNYIGYVLAKHVVKGAYRTARKDLTLRETPNGDELSSISQGEKVYVLSEYGDWSYVEYDEEKGYVFTQCLK